jgi:hypothetical protein
MTTIFSRARFVKVYLEYVSSRTSDGDMALFTTDPIPYEEHKGYQGYQSIENFSGEKQDIPEL